MGRLGLRGVRPPLHSHPQWQQIASTMEDASAVEALPTEFTCCRCFQWSPSSDLALHCAVCNSQFCPACRAAQRGHVCACGRGTCERACCGGPRAPCSSCGRRMCEDCARPSCASCGNNLCLDCGEDSATCDFCGAHTCEGCRLGDEGWWFCEPCGKFSCGDCDRVGCCGSCGMGLCDAKSCTPGLRPCGKCSAPFCSRCVEIGEAAQCEGCRELWCKVCDPLAQEPCDTCMFRYCARCLGPEQRFTCVGGYCEGPTCATKDCAGKDHTCSHCGVLKNCEELDATTVCDCYCNDARRCEFCAEPMCGECFGRKCGKCEGKLEKCCGVARCEECAREHACGV